MRDHRIGDCVDWLFAPWPPAIERAKSAHDSTFATLTPAARLGANGEVVLAAGAVPVVGLAALGATTRSLADIATTRARGLWPRVGSASERVLAALAMAEERTWSRARQARASAGSEAFRARRRAKKATPTSTATKERHVRCPEVKATIAANGRRQQKEKS